MFVSFSDIFWLKINSISENSVLTCSWYPIGSSGVSNVSVYVGLAVSSPIYNNVGPADVHASLLSVEDNRTVVESSYLFNF